MASDFTVLSADIVTLTSRVVKIRFSEGPRAGEEISLPRSVFEDPEVLERGDDEISVRTWWVEKNKAQ